MSMKQGTQSVCRDVWRFDECEALEMLWIDQRCLSRYARILEI